PTRMNTLFVAVLAIAAILFLIAALVLINFIGLWIRAAVAKAPVGMGKLIGMKLRRVPAAFIVDNRITAVKAGLDIPTDPLEAHYPSGVSVEQVILALIAPDK